MIEVQEMLEGIDPESLPNDPETNALLHATEYARINRLYADAMKAGRIAEEEMANARTDFAFADAMMRRDRIVQEVHALDAAQSAALAEYRKAQADFMQMPVLWEGDDS